MSGPPSSPPPPRIYSSVKVIISKGIHCPEGHMFPLISFLAGLLGGNPLPLLVLSTNGNNFPPPLSRLEEAECFRRMRKEGDAVSRGRIIEIRIAILIQKIMNGIAPEGFIYKGLRSMDGFGRMRIWPFCQLPRTDIKAQREFINDKKCYSLKVSQSKVLKTVVLIEVLKQSDYNIIVFVF